jgi:hypothetical protein
MVVGMTTKHSTNRLNVEMRHKKSTMWFSIGLRLSVALAPNQSFALSVPALAGYMEAAPQRSDEQPA